MKDVASIGMWVGFFIFVIIALSLDTFLLDKKHARPYESIRAALTWTLIWVISALIFNSILWVYLYFTTTVPFANEKALDFLTGYLIEKSLSIDNLFAFYMIFEQLQIPIANQQRVFSYGIWGAIIMRLLVILLFTWLVLRFHWLLYIMGAVLLLTGVKMLFFSGKEPDFSTNKILNWLQKNVRISNKIEGQRFFIRIQSDFPENSATSRGGVGVNKAKLYATPLFVALIFIEISDLIFAFDSIPAIFAITQDPFIIWTSNIFAILGLRALYFLLAKMVRRLYLLKYGIALILVVIGVKMMIEPWVPISAGLSLLIITSILLLFAGLSIAKGSRQGN